MERIGSDAGVVTHSVNGTAHTETLPLPTHTEALNRVIRYFSECGPNLNGANMVAIGHRIVQGGPYFHGPALIDDKVRNQIDELSDLGPLHNPAHLLGIDSARQMWPDLPHIGTLETEGAIRRSTPIETNLGMTYHIGVEFTALTPRERERLVQSIYQLQQSYLRKGLKIPQIDHTKRG